MREEYERDSGRLAKTKPRSEGDVPTEARREDQGHGLDNIPRVNDTSQADNKIEEEAEIRRKLAAVDEAMAAAKRAFAHAEKEDYRKAAKNYTHALKVLPQDADTLRMALLSNRGIMHVSLGQLDEAIADFTQAIKIDPSFAQPYHNRGCAHMDNKDYARAIDDLTKAAKINPKDEKTHQNIREVLKVYQPRHFSTTPVDSAELQKPFSYVIDSPPAELADNIEQAARSIMSDADATRGQHSQMLRDLCIALDLYLQPAPTQERVDAFLGVFATMLEVFEQAGGLLVAAETADSSDQTLAEAIRTPYGQLCRALFRAHQESENHSRNMDAELMRCLELALIAHQDTDSYYSGKSAVISLMAAHAQWLFSIDSEWTETHLFCYLSAQSPYRKNAAQALLESGYWLQPDFLAGIQEYFLEILADIDSCYGEPEEIRRACRWLYQIGGRALRTDDEPMITKVSGLFKALPERTKAMSIIALCYVFDDNDDYGDDDMGLLAREQVAQFIDRLYPKDQEFRFEWATVCFVGLIMRAKEHALGVYEACKELLLPVTDEDHQHHLYMKLAHDKDRFYLYSKYPELATDIIARTAILNGIWGDKLKELKELPLATAAH